MQFRVQINRSTAVTLESDTADTAVTEALAGKGESATTSSIQVTPLPKPPGAS